MSEQLSRRGFLKEAGKKVGVIGLGSLGLSVLAGCGGREREHVNVEQRLSELGLSGSHELVDLRKVPGMTFNGYLNGGFIFTSGEINGKTETVVQFAWKWTWRKTPDESVIVISELPVSKVMFNVDDSIDKKPDVRINFDTYSLQFAFDWEDRHIDPNNPNSYLSYSTLAIFDLSENDFKSFKGNQQSPN
ncbi:MAG: hypothetical protein COY68_01455 [Candidatus Levybacteria bacterium CG_4_10_14_0_8_um_filter_35_23]|nr:MAG: hypothetical protein COY68_01455 [Candidatus Levybacteria bacterium CG_4_10_14_0_8_um_filter_35_23]